MYIKLIWSRYAARPPFIVIYVTASTLLGRFSKSLLHISVGIVLLSACNTLNSSEVIVGHYGLAHNWRSNSAHSYWRRLRLGFWAVYSNCRTFVISNHSVVACLLCTPTLSSWKYKRYLTNCCQRVRSYNKK